jgi:pimeloyl-ACP methyl ester carboxylesterase
MLPIFYGHLGNDVAFHQFFHYGQIVKSGRFHYYDHGPWKNQQLYGSLTPPDYDAAKITAPAILLSGSLDNLVPADQVKKFSLLLPNLVQYREISQITHLDFVIHQQIRQRVNNDVVANAVKYKTCQYCFF